MTLHSFLKVPMGVFLLQFVFLMLSVTPYAHCCPTSTGWSEEYQSKCYFTSSSNALGGAPVEQVLNYPDARKRCQSLGGDLISVNTAPELGFMRELLASQVSSHHNHWIGAKRTSATPTWSWEDGSEVAGSWIPHIITFGDSSLDIAVYTTTGLWGEARISTALHYVCEKDVWAATTTRVTTTSATTATNMPAATTTTISKPFPTISAKVSSSATSPSATNPKNNGSYECMSWPTSCQNSHQLDSSRYKGIGIGIGATIGIELLILVPTIIFLVRRRKTPNKDSLSDEAAPPAYINSNVTMTTSPSNRNKNSDGAVYSDIVHQRETPEQEHAYEALHA